MIRTLVSLTIPIVFVLSCSEIQEKQENSNNISFEKLLENKGVIHLDEILKDSEIGHKPVILFFTGYNVASNRRLEQNVLNKIEVIRRCSNDFLFITVYVDDKRALPNNLNTASCELMKTPIKTIGDANMCLQIDLCGLASQPYFLAIDSRGKTLGNGTYEDFGNKSDFLNFLEEVENVFNEKS
jgi:hypothetical protein